MGVQSTAVDGFVWQADNCTIVGMLLKAYFASCGPCREVSQMVIASPNAVLNFWIEAGTGKWWKKDPAFDADIAHRFADTHEAACNGELDHWMDQPDSALALILVLDQFSRNLFRNSPKAFAQDQKCSDIARRQIESGANRSMPREIENFCYLPLMHCEDLESQELCLKEMKRLGDELSIKSAVEHMEIIDKFGRFPHRNAVLRRHTTVEEQAFLDGGGFSG